jgi:hypothetical protein
MAYNTGHRLLARGNTIDPPVYEINTSVVAEAM